MTDNQSSAARIREMLRLHEDALRMYQTEAAYQFQVDYTCQLLDVVDEVTDPVTAMLITDRIYGRLTGDGIGEAEKRIRDARALMEVLQRAPLRQRWSDT